jgi:hypothetical protein
MLQPTTTRYAPSASGKPFAWSYTKLKNFEACPKRHYHVDIRKDFKEEESEQLKHGNRVHTIFDQYLRHGTVMPPMLEPELMPWIKRVFTFQGKDVRDYGAVVSAEQQLAITKDFAPCEWFGKAAWYRAKIDVMWRLGPLGGIVDWKTGKVLEDSVQLMLSAACAFYHYPELQIIRSTFAWLADDCQTDCDIRREQLPELWNNLWERIETLRLAHEQSSYPPTPCRLCRAWCPVTVCPHHGDRHAG